MSKDAEPSRWRTRAAEVLDHRFWSYRTEAVRALHWSFCVRTDDVELGAHFDRIFAGLPRSEEGEDVHEYSLLLRPRDGWVRHRVYVDSERILDTPVPSLAFRHLIWHVNQAVIDTAAPLTTIHAGVVASRGRAIVMPAAMESGKSTLTAGLVRRGFDYLSDEAAAIDPATGLVVPFSRALSVDPGSHEVLAALEPEIHPELLPWVEEQWQLPPDEIRPGSVSGPVPVGLLVFPRYEAGAVTCFQPLDRAEVLEELVANALNLHITAPDGFVALAEVARTIAGWRMLVGDLDEACELIEALVSGRPAGHHLADTVTQLEIGEETMLYDEATRSLHRLGPEASGIWRELISGNDLETVAQRLVWRSGLEGDEAFKQVVELVDELRGSGVLLADSDLT